MDEENALVDEALDRLALLETSELDEEKRRDLTNWLHQSQAHAMAWEKATKLWELFGQVEFTPDLYTNPSKAAERASSFFNYLKPLTVVAVSVLLILVSLDILNFNQLSDSEYQSSWGELRTINLSDGSTVFLNFDSEISVDIAEDRRNIDLKKGEALFKVEKDSTRPFIVTSGNTTTKATGTAFDIRLVQHNETKITVTEGHVEVTSPLEREPIKLSANETITARDGKLEQPQKLESEYVSSWERGLLVFKHTPLNEVLTELNRYTKYDIQFMLGEKHTNQITGTFLIDRIDEGLKSLIQSHDLDAVVTSDGTRIITNYET